MIACIRNVDITRIVLLKLYLTHFPQKCYIATLYLGDWVKNR